MTSDTLPRGLAVAVAVAVALTVAGGISGAGLRAAAAGQPPDRWVAAPVQYPPGTDAALVQSNEFANLRAEVVAGRLKIVWVPAQFSPRPNVVLRTSADVLGHWPARDWRSTPLLPRGAHWEATVPVEDVVVPLVYYVSVTASNGVRHSPMRVVEPHAAGLETPTRLFWPFLEGFEVDLEGWRLLSPAAFGALRTDPTAKNGRAALAVSLPAGKRSVTVATTRVRGWQIVQQGAIGLRLWVRTRAGAGRARFTLLAQAFTADQVMAVWPKEFELSSQWRKVELAFGEFPRLPLAGVDLFTAELIGEGPQEFLLDDLQLLGGWELDPE